MLSIIELVQLTIAMYRRNFGLFLGYSGWVLIPSVILVITPAISPASYTAISLTALILTMVLTIWIWIIISKITAQIIHKEKINTETLAMECWQRILPVIGVSLLTSLMSLVGFIFFIVPGIIIMVWYAFATTEVILHGKRPLEALATSRDLTRGKFFAILWRLLGGTIFLGAIYLVLSLTLISLTELLTSGAVTFMSSTPSIGAQLLGAVADTLAFPLFVIYPVIFYLDIKQSSKNEKKEKISHKTA